MPVVTIKRAPTGRNTILVLDKLQKLDSNVVTVREVMTAARDVLPDRRRCAEVITWLQRNGWLTPTVGGVRIEASESASVRISNSDAFERDGERKNNDLALIRQKPRPHRVAPDRCE
ncbi:MAG: hypothetical protein ACT4O5_05920 [Gammaproteobacteria bacterium]